MAEEIKAPRFGAPTKRGLTRIADFVKRLNEAEADQVESLLKGFQRRSAKEQREYVQALAWISTKCLVLK